MADSQCLFATAYKGSLNYVTSFVSYYCICVNATLVYKHKYFQLKPCLNAEIIKYVYCTYKGIAFCCFAEHLIVGETLLSLSERMIDKLFPIIKTQVKFAKLLASLKDVPKFTEW